MTNSMAAQFSAFARYNFWANNRLYNACGQLDETEYLKVRPAFFKSIHGVLNHGLLTDRSQLGWVTGQPYKLDSLDQQLYADFFSLRDARVAEDAHIIDYVEHLADDAFEADITFTNIRGTTMIGALRLLLNHLFNHQSHHRGQAHDLLTQTTVAPPPLDFLLFLRQPECGLVRDLS